MNDFYLMGSKLQTNIKKNIIAAQAEFTTDQVSQLAITLLDPNFDFLDTGLCKIGTPCRLQNIDLVVASVETSATAGNPTVTVKCRPKVVQDLKNRTGTKVMQGASPSDFVKAECKAVGANAYIQASPQRASVSRDIPEAGQTYTPDRKPSSWTTFQRLANELGYIVFEENGTIYFGQPTYFTLRGKELPLKVGFRTGDNRNRALGIPECSKSLDSAETTISVQLPLSRAFEARCGRTMKLSGVPEFDGFYMVSAVNFDLAGSTELMTVEAKTPVDPVAQPPEGSNLIVGALNQAGASSDGSWPLPKQYKVTTAYGVRGGWAAGFHTGADFACPQGTPVYAVYDGKVVAKNSWGADYGTHVILKVGNAEWGYMHLSRITVAVGSQVKSGQIIGYSGNTGNTTGPHLHLEYRTAPFKYNNKVHDPIPQLMKKGVSSGISSISAGKNGSKSAADFAYWAGTRAGGKYVFGAARTPSNANQMQFDCSSLVQWALYQVGITNFPGDTVSQTAYLNRKGTRISIEQAVNTRGALLYRLGGGGKSDHVAISLGNGTTIEASSPSIGIGNQSALGRGWNAAYLVPGLRYGS
jgi:murein DD-endopeptidase MepM/ murein hydrolase activator NlpD